MENKTLELIVKSLDSKRAEDIEVIGISDLTVIADYFVIANGTSTIHTKTLADEVEFQLFEKLGLKPTRTEGYQAGNWVILDYSDIVVHVFNKETRDYYQLERLWADGKYVDIKDIIIQENN